MEYFSLIAATFTISPLISALLIAIAAHAEMSESAWPPSLRNHDVADMVMNALLPASCRARM